VPAGTAAGAALDTKLVERYEASVQVSVLAFSWNSYNCSNRSIVVGPVYIGPWLRWLIALTRSLVDRYEFVYAPLVGGDHAETFIEHREIVRAVRDGSASIVEAALRRNWINGGERLGAAMARLGPRGDW